MANVAFIGLGNMGGPMATNLVKASHNVVVFDLAPGRPATNWQARGASIAATAAEAAVGADCVISMLPAGKHVAATYLGDTGLLANTGYRHDGARLQYDRCCHCAGSR